MVTLTLITAGPPKRQIIELAFGDIGSAGYEFGRTPEEVNDALLRLNALMREYPFSTLGYDQPAYGVGRPEDLSGIPDQWLSVVAAKLALRICPMMGATMSTEAKANLASGMALLQAAAATIPTMPYQRSTPSGAGSRFGPFLRSPAIDETDTSDPGDLAALLP
jgi:hypothetical protein